ncbi:hypothetical protein NHX12_025151 [Muraenolepis orangiensis]|uniref:Metallo-beta-lactamase domain-containing protein n=1 Tax=Muraenolepis orangiensis TaxID=630683 RepID=A0A9Q0ELM2_9TELE|nr:hypothetical protein NHX12_025151 [Muraenolepis orangiensis]
MSQKDDSEDDIWEFKLLRKKKKKTAASTSPKETPKRHNCSTAKSSTRDVKYTEEDGVINQGHVPYTSVKNPGNPGSINKTSAPEVSPGQSVQEAVTAWHHTLCSPASLEPTGDGATESVFCPICQMPFSILVAQSQTGHATECLDTPRDDMLECPDGLQCSSVILNHYKRYNHALLAHGRAANNSVLLFLSQAGERVRSTLAKSEDSLELFSDNDDYLFTDFLVHLESDLVPEQALLVSSTQPALSQRMAGQVSSFKQTDIGVLFGLKSLKDQQGEPGSRVQAPKATTTPAIEGISAYFLTHFHSDHYGGLTKKSTLPVYCNKITGNLVRSKLKVQERYLHILPMNTRVTVCGVEVTLMEANHCPGAAMLLFSLPDGQIVLHTGDFRANPKMESYPDLLSCRVQTLYLDTTYCSPEYTFPSQQEAVHFAANTAFEVVALHPRTLVVCGSYSVGKEKVFLALAEVLGSNICLSRDKYNTMCCLESEPIKKLLTTDWKAAQVHVLPMMQLNVKVTA